jgi:hypothetical protein
MTFIIFFDNLNYGNFLNATHRQVEKFAIICGEKNCNAAGCGNTHKTDKNISRKN